VDDLLLCIGCGKAIWPGQPMTLMTAELTDPETGEAVSTNPTPIHTGCEGAFRERVEAEEG
jgi:hypothetical protein